MRVSGKRNLKLIETKTNCFHANKNEKCMCIHFTFAANLFFWIAVICVLKGLRFIEECSNLPFNDGEHIIYVNGSMRPSDTALGKLMSDMFCTDAKDMNYKLLSDKVRYLKETEEGVEMMFCSLEDMRNETEYKTKLRLAANLIANGKLSFEEIATLAELPLEKIKELAEEQSA